MHNLRDLFFLIFLMVCFFGLVVCSYILPDLSVWKVGDLTSYDSIKILLTRIDIPRIFHFTQDKILQSGKNVIATNQTKNTAYPKNKTTTTTTTNKTPNKQNTHKQKNNILSNVSSFFVENVFLHRFSQWITCKVVCRLV